jgi:hypothetical protein
MNPAMCRTEPFCNPVILTMQMPIISSFRFLCPENVKPKKRK